MRGLEDSVRVPFFHFIKMECGISIVFIYSNRPQPIPMTFLRLQVLTLSLPFLAILLCLCCSLHHYRLPQSILFFTLITTTQNVFEANQQGKLQSNVYVGMGVVTIRYDRWIIIHGTRQLDALLSGEFLLSVIRIGT
jgi:hypothetical protein